MFKSYRRARRAVAGASAVALVVAGFASSNAMSAQKKLSGPLKQAATYYAKFTHGTAGKAASSKAPVKIGYIDDVGGVPSFPANPVAVAAAVSFANSLLGGVNGQPIKVISCFVSTSEQQGQACAQQFLAAKVKVIVEGNLILGSQSFHQAINGAIPVIVGAPSNAADINAKSTYALGPGGFGTVPTMVAYVTHVLHAKTASVLYPNDSALTVQLAGQFNTQLGAAGVNVTEAGFESTTPDLLPSVIAAKSTSTDVTLVLLATPSLCEEGAQALQTAGVTKPVLSLGTCVSVPVKAALGDYPKWTYSFGVENSAALGDPALHGYLAAMKQYAPKGSDTSALPEETFLPVLAAVRAMNLAGGGSAKPAAIAAQVKSFKGPIPLFAPTVEYGSIPGAPALPNELERLYTYAGNGNWADDDGGRWIGVK
jgi:branched-chain amino acid transport system substrate-binding protein